MATFEFTLRGDQIGTFSSLSGDGNGVDRVVTLGNVSAYGSASDVYTIRVDQVAPGGAQFANGQFVTILDSLGNVVMTQTGIQPDTEQGLGAGDEHLIIGSTGFLIDLTGLEPGPQQVQYAFADEAAQTGLGDNDGELDFADTVANFPCFATGTLIRTPNGERPVETLQQGDLVDTLDSDPQPVLWIRDRLIRLMPGCDQQRPVQIPAQAIGLDQPHRVLIVSPQHRLFFSAQVLNRNRGRLLPAKGLVGHQGIRLMRGRETVRYHSLLLASHQVIWANGCPCESFYPGDYVLHALPDDLRQELFALLPLLKLGAAIGYGPPVREVETVQQAKQMVASAGVLPRKPRLQPRLARVL